MTRFTYKNTSLAAVFMLISKLKLKLGGWAFWKHATAEVCMRDAASNCEKKRADSIDFWKVVKKDLLDNWDEEKQKSQFLRRENG